MREPEGANGAGSLSLRQLEYLVVTVGEGRLTRAAQRLHVTEPTVSQQLKALEGAVGTPLLVRGPDGVRPTPAGEALLPHARTALRSAGQGRAAALAAAGGHGETLRVATLPSLLTGLLPVLRAWALAHPDARLVVGVHESLRGLRESVASGAADLAVGPRPAGWPGQVWPWQVEEIVVVCGEDDPLRGEVVPVRDLLGRRWVHYPGDGRVPLSLLGETRTDDPVPRPATLSVPTADAAVALAASGAGLTAVPLGSLPARLHSQTVALVPRATADVVLFAAPDAPAGTLAHAAALCRCAAQQAPDG